MNLNTDVCIMGGGLAGLSLALQLKQTRPETQVHVLERREGPAPDAGFKVGESTVEIGAHYFANTLNLKDYLAEAHIRKFGFRFFFSDGTHAIDKTTEVGVSMLLPTPSWQLDRGRFENDLQARVEALGVQVHMGASVKNADIREDGSAHSVTFEQNGARHTIDARWVVDAAGRTNLLKRKFDLAKTNAHDVNSAWWRVQGRLDPNDWSSDTDWLDRCTPPDRWRSTNHLCGEGYWVWMIPLSSGTHSIGIVADQALHPLDSMNTHEKAMAWLATHQPQLHKNLLAEQHSLVDFRFLRHFSHDCKQVFSKHRWAITGEAGVFPDPFYSPGSDFIAISNTYVTDLICKDFSGHEIAAYADLFQQLLFSFHENTLTLYQDQYPIFGNARVMPVKVIWDYTYYWALLAPLYMSGRIASLPVLARLRAQFEFASKVNLAMQPLLLAWHRACDYGVPEDGRSLDQYNIDWFNEMNRALGDELSDSEFMKRVDDNLKILGQLAAEIADFVRARHPDVDLSAIDTLIPAGTHQNKAPLLEPVWFAVAA